MSEEKSPAVSVIEAHEEFIQHVETGSSKVRTLSAVTIVVAGILSLSYVYQLLLPYATGTTSVTVSLTDPLLQVTQVALLALTSLWLYVATRDYFFSKRMARAIREARALEKEIEKRVTS